MAFPFLSEEEIFPHPSEAEEQGIVAIGGDLTPSRLLSAYHFGIFPWYSEEDPIIWWSPDPRFVLFPNNLKISKSMRPYFNQAKYQITYDTHFSLVILACQRIKRKNQSGTWITSEMAIAYEKLHELGYAHSVEVWSEGKLAGGLYGISLGKMFFGESMFTLAPNASKFAFISLVSNLKKKGFTLIDCQQETAHLESLGAASISRDSFLDLLSVNRKEKSANFKWTDWFSN